MNSKEKQGKAWPVVLCLLLAGGIFALLLNVETKQLAQYEKGSVVVAIADVTDNKEITEENLKELFAVEENYGKAVLLGVNMEALEQSVAGTLRAGDEIDIYTVMVDEEDNVIVEKALSNVTIERSYTSAGMSILKDDKSANEALETVGDCCSAEVVVCTECNCREVREKDSTNYIDVEMVSVMAVVIRQSDSSEERIMRRIFSKFILVLAMCLMLTPVTSYAAASTSEMDQFPNCQKCLTYCITKSIICIDVEKESSYEQNGSPKIRYN